jgi:hypothetical protein
MGLDSSRSAAALAILQDHYMNALTFDGGTSTTNALKSTFVLACTSPYVAGIGQ